MRNELIEAALGVRRWAYAPYSKYLVGAALLTSSGRVYDGVNIENAAFPLTICAERVAVFKAVSQGERQFAAIAVVSDMGGAPCGSCRQVLSEFAPQLPVILVDREGRVTRETTVSELLPEAFGPKDLLERE